MSTIDRRSDADIALESSPFCLIDRTSEADTTEYRQSIEEKISYLIVFKSCPGDCSDPDDSVIDRSIEISEAISREAP